MAGGSEKPSRIRRAVGVFLTFHVVAAGWVLFRADSFGAAIRMFESIASLEFGSANLSWKILAVLGIAAAAHWFPAIWFERLKRLFHAAPAPLQAAVVIVAILAMRQIARTDIAPFIYFQF